MIAQVAQVRESFRNHFGKSPRLFFAPGRINLLGEHVDYNDGFVMPAAIGQGIVFGILPNYSGKYSNVIALDVSEQDRICLTDIYNRKGWPNYIRGVLDQLTKRGLELEGFDLVFSGNLPQGAGLSSSAALECGVAFALNEIFQYGLSRVELARICQSAEHTYPGVQCGIMDQFACLMGKEKKGILLDCRSLTFEYFPLQLTDYAIVLLNTEVHHALDGSEYNIRRNECAEGLRILQQKFSGVTSFREVNMPQLDAVREQLPGKIYQRCKFVIEEIQRTQQAAYHLREDNVTEFGKLLFDCHHGLSELYEVSCEQSDFLVREANKWGGVLGARQIGGGFGGCVLNLLPSTQVDSFAGAMQVAYEERYHRRPEVYVVKAGDGVREIT